MAHQWLELYATLSNKRVGKLEINPLFNVFLMYVYAFVKHFEFVLCLAGAI